MSPVELATNDLPVFLQSMRGERQTTVIVYGLPFCGKSKFARALAESKGWDYLDVMSVLSEQSETARKIDQIDISDLKQLILSQTGNAEVVLVDELDFLFPLWGDLQPFKEMVRTLHNSARPVVYAFFLQTRHDWDDWNLFTAGHQSRIFTFETIKPL
jgi:hypothetical protein